MEQTQLQAVWEQILTKMKETLAESAFKWFKSVKPLSLTDDGFVLSVQNDLVKDWITSHYLTIVEDAVSAVLGSKHKVSFQVVPEAQPEPEPAKQEAAKEEETAASHSSSRKKEDPNQGSLFQDQPPAPVDNGDMHIVAPGDRSSLNPKYTFETFVVGSGNRFAHAAALSVATDPAHSYNPLFIYGGVGLGKTHLMHAVGNFIREHDPSKRILYIPGETFTNELISAIQQGRNIQFRNRFRSVDVLMVDDIQFIAGKESTQEEFFHTFNTLHTAGKQIILTSDRPPQEIARLEDRLKSRFAWGLTCDIKKPDVETRIAILREKARQENITMDEDVYEAIATRVESNIRELEGSLTRLVAYAQLTNRPITVQLCEEALHDIFAKKVRKEVTAQVIMQAVANYYSITVDDLIRPTRRREIAVPRQIAMYITRDLTNLSLPQIGQVFGNRDHTTVLHGCNQIANAIKNDPSMASVVNDLKEIIVDNK